MPVVNSVGGLNHNNTFEKSSLQNGNLYHLSQLACRVEIHSAFPTTERSGRDQPTGACA